VSPRGQAAARRGLLRLVELLPAQLVFVFYIWLFYFCIVSRALMLASMPFKATGAPEFWHRMYSLSHHPLLAYTYFMEDPALFIPPYFMVCWKLCQPDCALKLLTKDTVAYIISILKGRTRLGRLKKIKADKSLWDSWMEPQTMLDMAGRMAVSCDSIARLVLSVDKSKIVFPAEGDVPPGCWMSRLCDDYYPVVHFAASCEPASPLLHDPHTIKVCCQCFADEHGYTHLYTGASTHCRETTGSHRDIDPAHPSIRALASIQITCNDRCCKDLGMCVDYDGLKRVKGLLGGRTFRMQAFPSLGFESKEVFTSRDLPPLHINLGDGKALWARSVRQEAENLAQLHGDYWREMDSSFPGDPRNYPGNEDIVDGGVPGLFAEERAVLSRRRLKKTVLLKAAAARRKRWEIVNKFKGPWPDTRSGTREYMMQAKCKLELHRQWLATRTSPPGSKKRQRLVVEFEYDSEDGSASEGDI